MSSPSDKKSSPTLSLDEDLDIVTPRKDAYYFRDVPAYPIEKDKIEDWKVLDSPIPTGVIENKYGGKFLLIYGREGKYGAVWTSSKAYNQDLYGLTSREVYLVPFLSELEEFPSELKPLSVKDGIVTFDWGDVKIRTEEDSPLPAILEEGEKYGTIEDKMKFVANSLLKERGIPSGVYIDGESPMVFVTLTAYSKMEAEKAFRIYGKSILEQDIILMSEGNNPLRLKAFSQRLSGPKRYTSPFIGNVDKGSPEFQKKSDELLYKVLATDDSNRFYDVLLHMIKYAESEAVYRLTLKEAEDYIAVQVYTRKVFSRGDYHPTVFSSIIKYPKLFELLESKFMSTFTVPRLIDVLSRDEIRFVHEIPRVKVSLTRKTDSYSIPLNELPFVMNMNTYSSLSGRYKFMGEEDKHPMGMMNLPDSMIASLKYSIGLPLTLLLKLFRTLDLTETVMTGSGIVPSLFWGSWSTKRRLFPGYFTIPSVEGKDRRESLIELSKVAKGSFRIEEEGNEISVIGDGKVIGFEWEVGHPIHLLVTSNNFRKTAIGHVKAIRGIIPRMVVQEIGELIQLTDPQHEYRPWIIYENGRSVGLEDFFRLPCPERVFITKAYGKLEVFASVSAILAYSKSQMPNFFYEYIEGVSPMIDICRYTLAGFYYGHETIIGTASQIYNSRASVKGALKDSVMSENVVNGWIIQGGYMDGFDIRTLREIDTEIPSTIKSEGKGPEGREVKIKEESIPTVGQTIPLEFRERKTPPLEIQRKESKMQEVWSETGVRTLVPVGYQPPPSPQQIDPLLADLPPVILAQVLPPGPQ